MHSRFRRARNHFIISSRIQTRLRTCFGGRSSRCTTFMRKPSVGRDNPSVARQSVGEAHHHHVRVRPALPFPLLQMWWLHGDYAALGPQLSWDCERRGEGRRKRGKLRRAGAATCDVGVRDRRDGHFQEKLSIRQTFRHGS